MHSQWTPGQDTGSVQYHAEDIPKGGVQCIEISDADTIEYTGEYP